MDEKDVETPSGESHSLPPGAEAENERVGKNLEADTPVPSAPGEHPQEPEAIALPAAEESRSPGEATPPDEGPPAPPETTDDSPPAGPLGETWPRRLTAPEAEMASTPEKLPAEDSAAARLERVMRVDEKIVAENLARKKRAEEERRQRETSSAPAVLPEKPRKMSAERAARISAGRRRLRGIFPFWVYVLYVLVLLLVLVIALGYRVMVRQPAKEAYEAVLHFVRARSEGEKQAAAIRLRQLGEPALAIIRKTLAAVRDPQESPGDRLLKDMRLLDLLHRLDRLEAALEASPPALWLYLEGKERQIEEEALGELKGCKVLAWHESEHTFDFLAGKQSGVGAGQTVHLYREGEQVGEAVVTESGSEVSQARMVAGEARVGDQVRPAVLPGLPPRWGGLRAQAEAALEGRRAFAVAYLLDVIRAGPQEAAARDALARLLQLEAARETLPLLRELIVSQDHTFDLTWDETYAALSGEPFEPSSTDVEKLKWPLHKRLDDPQHPFLSVPDAYYRFMTRCRQLGLDLSADDLYRLVWLLREYSGTLLVGLEKYCQLAPSLWHKHLPELAGLDKNASPETCRKIGVKMVYLIDRYRKDGRLPPPADAGAGNARSPGEAPE